MVTGSMVSRSWLALAGASIAKCFDSGAVRKGANSRCSIGEIRRFSCRNWLLNETQYNANQGGQDGTRI